MLKSYALLGLKIACLVAGLVCIGVVASALNRMGEKRNSIVKELTEPIKPIRFQPMR